MNALAERPVRVETRASPLALLRCPGCRAEVASSHSVYECDACGRCYPVLGGVIVLIADTMPLRGPMLDPAAATALVAGLGLPTDPITHLRVRQVSGVRAQRHGTPRPLSPTERLARPSLVNDKGNIRCAWLGEHVPRRLAPGCDVLANIRFRNDGTGVLRASGDGRVTIAGQWTDATGGPVVHEDIRTPLTADLIPGQELTVAVQLRPPTVPWRYLLSIRMVLEGVRWLDPAFGPFPVSLRAGAGRRPEWPQAWTEPVGSGRLHACFLLRRWLAQTSRGEPRIVELDGGTNPLTARAGFDSLIVGTDLLAMQLGQLAPAALPAICADLDDLPLAESAYDAIVMFGAMHHWPDPARTLGSLVDHLCPGGFIGVFGLPVGQRVSGSAPAGVLDAIRCGSNPQGFSRAEYAQMFRSARLRVTHRADDGGHLTLRLQPECGNA